MFSWYQAPLKKSNVTLKNISFTELKNDLPTPPKPPESSSCASTVTSIQTSQLPSEISRVASIELIPGPDGHQYEISKCSTKNSSSRYTSNLGSVTEVSISDRSDILNDTVSDQGIGTNTCPKTTPSPKNFPPDLLASTPMSSSPGASLLHADIHPSEITKLQPSQFGIAFAHMLIQKYDTISDPAERDEAQFTLILCSRIYTKPVDLMLGLSFALELQEPRVQKWVHDHKIIMEVEQVNKAGENAQLNRNRSKNRKRIIPNQSSTLPNRQVGHVKSNFPKSLRSVSTHDSGYIISVNSDDHYSSTGSHSTVSYI